MAQAQIKEAQVKEAQVQEAQIAGLAAQVKGQALNEASIRLLENSVKEAEQEEATSDLEKASLSEKYALLNALEATHSAVVHEAETSQLQVRISELASSLTRTTIEQ